MASEKPLSPNFEALHIRRRRQKPFFPASELMLMMSPAPAGGGISAKILTADSSDHAPVRLSPIMCCHSSGTQIGHAAEHAEHPALLIRMSMPPNAVPPNRSDKTSHVFNF